MGTATWSWDGRWHCPTTSRPCLTAGGVSPSLSQGRQELGGKGRAQPRPRFPPCTPLEGQALVLTAGGLGQCLGHATPAPAGPRRWFWRSERPSAPGRREHLAGAGRPGGWRTSCPVQSGSGCCVPLATSRRWGGCTPHSGWVLVAGEAAELLPQGLEAGPLLRVPVPAREHQPVGTGWALRGAGHAVARVHPREGLVVGHACGEWGRAATVPPRTPATLSPSAPPTPISKALTPDSTQVLRMVSRSQSSHAARAQYLDRASGPC